jgi:hypothetical protein
MWGSQLKWDLEEQSVESLEESLRIPLGTVREDFRVAWLLKWGWHRKRVKTGAVGGYLSFYMERGSLISGRGWVGNCFMIIGDDPLTLLSYFAPGGW